MAAVAGAAALLDPQSPGARGQGAARCAAGWEKADVAGERGRWVVGWESVGFVGVWKVVGVSGGVWRVARRFWACARWVREGIGEEFVGREM
jgi:hypothetical protein